jgi:hypothetical protein
VGTSVDTMDLEVIGISVVLSNFELTIG